MNRTLCSTSRIYQNSIKLKIQCNNYHLSSNSLIKLPFNKTTNSINLPKKSKNFTRPLTKYTKDKIEKVKYF